LLFFLLSHFKCDSKKKDVISTYYKEKNDLAKQTTSFVNIL